MSGDFCKHYGQVVTEFFQTVIALLKRALELDKVCGGNFGFILAEEAFAPDVEQYFQSYGWPGNVRQLQNVVRNIVVMHDGDVVEMEMLPRMSDGGKAAADIPTSAAPSPKMAPTHGAPIGFMRASPADAIEPIAVAERRYIEQAIDLCDGNIHWAARQLGISPSTIYRKKEGWGA